MYILMSLIFYFKLVLSKKANILYKFKWFAFSIITSIIHSELQTTETLLMYQQMVMQRTSTIVGHAIFFFPWLSCFCFCNHINSVCQRQNWFSSSSQRATAIDLSFCYQRDQRPLNLKSSLTSSQSPSNSQFNQFFSHDAFQIYLWISSLTASILDKVHVPVVCSASLITIL